MRFFLSAQFKYYFLKSYCRSKQGILALLTVQGQFSVWFILWKYANFVMNGSSQCQFAFPPQKSLQTRTLPILQTPDARKYFVSAVQCINHVIAFFEKNDFLVSYGFLGSNASFELIILPLKGPSSVFLYAGKRTFSRFTTHKACKNRKGFIFQCINHVIEKSDVMFMTSIRSDVKFYCQIQCINHVITLQVYTRYTLEFRNNSHNVHAIFFQIGNG